MKRVKLYTLWVGPLPAWMPEFLRRVRALETVDWELLAFDTPGQACDALWFDVRDAKGACKATPYACGDLRPWLASWQRPLHEWWGWCDLDVVLGDLDRLLPPLLDAFDVVSAEQGGTAGCLTLFRNTPETRELWRTATGWEAVLADPAYRNFDEVGFNLMGGNPSITRALRRSNLRCHFDWRSWHEEQEPMPDGRPSRRCLYDGKAIREVPTGRELLLYHFRGKNGLPAPVMPGSLIEKEMQQFVDRGRTCKVLSPEFWAERLRRAKAGGDVHRAVCDMSWADWQTVQDQTREILKQHLKAGDRVLDCGCGPGLMREVMPQKVDWVGVDFCPEMVDENIHKSEIIHTMLGDVRNLQLEDSTFDWCVCRNLEGDAEAECSEDWGKMRREMLRVAPRLLLIDLRGRRRVIERGT